MKKQNRFKMTKNKKGQIIVLDRQLKLKFTYEEYKDALFILGLLIEVPTNSEKFIENLML